MDQDFTPFSIALARAQFWRDGRKSVENGEPEPGMPTGAIIAHENRRKPHTCRESCTLSSRFDREGCVRHEKQL
jgi:hypothetical protein